MKEIKNTPPSLDMLDMMGENVRSSLKYCGENVILYPLCKIVRAERLEIDDNSRIFDYAFVDAGAGTKIGKYSFITWHALIEGGAKAIILTGPSENIADKLIECLQEGGKLMIVGTNTKKMEFTINPII